MVFRQLSLIPVLLMIGPAVSLVWSGDRLFGWEHFGGAAGSNLANRQDATQDASQPAEGNVDTDPKPLRRGALIQVPLPITGEVDRQVQRVISRAAERLTAGDAGEERPILVLEFAIENGATGEGSEFERCVSLARFLTSSQLNHVHTVAYIPAAKGYAEDQQPFQLQSELKGHAVLVALACQELILHRDASLGAAGSDEDYIDELLSHTYQRIAARRRTLPIPLVLSLLDKDKALYRVVTEKGVLYVDADELSKLETDGQVIESETVTDMGQAAMLTSDELLSFRLIPYRVDGRRELAQRLRLHSDSLQGDPSLGGQWHAVQFSLEGPVQQKNVNWIIRSLGKRFASEPTNLIVISIDSQGGSIAECLRLAHHLSEYNSAEVRTVAYVSGRARGGAALVALACDHLVMSEEAVIGGAARPELTAEELSDLQISIRKLAETKQRDWSVYQGLVDPNVVLKRYRHLETGQLRLLCDEQFQQLEDQDKWGPLGEIDSSEGLDATTAERLLIARYLANSFDELKSLYQLDEDPVVLEPTFADRWIEGLARELASPWVAGWLLFAAMFFMSAELSQPGIGIPGFIATICIVLFFWSQYCDGNAHWLEILLFAVGAIFLLMEIFVIPGIGIFGIGGVLMMVASIVLASQTFVFPRNSTEFAHLPTSLSMVLAAGGGVAVAMFVLRRYLPHLPYFKRLMLQPPVDERLNEQSHRETLAHYEHLQGKRGVTATRLMPSGKAMIGSEMVHVITDGRLLEKGVPIVVSEVSGNRIVVRSAEDK